MMRKNQLFYILGIILFCLPDLLYAVPSRRKPIEKKLPDGSVITIILNGDEFRSWITTSDGFSVKQQTDGFYYYLETNQSADTLRCSAIKANNPAKRKPAEKNYLQQLKKQLIAPTKKQNIRSRISVPVIDPEKKGWLLNDNNYRAKGNLDFIVVPVSFPDKKITLTPKELERLCNEKGLKEWGLAGSVKDYFEDMSFGQFSVNARVLPVYTTQNKYGGYDKNGTSMDREILNYLYFQGYTHTDITRYGAPIIAVVFPGFSQSETGDTEAIWANQHFYEFDSKLYYATLASFLYTPEFDNYPETLPGTYTFCHEFSHTLGIPDLYDTDYEYGGQHFNHGSWDIMVGGLGRNAPSHNSFTRYRMGWIKNAIELNKPGAVKIQGVEEEECGYFFRSKTKGEFFWLENRQPSKWDLELPDYGMLIYHVDSTTWVNHTVGHATMGGWADYNVINGNAERPGFDLEEADNVKNEETVSGDIFPGTAHITSFTDQTSPNSRDYTGVGSEKPLTNISLVDRMISFDFMGGGNASAEVITTNTYLKTANSFVLEMAIKYGSELKDISECGVMYGLTPISQTQKKTTPVTGKNISIEISNLNNNLLYYLRPYIVVKEQTVSDAVRNIRTTLPEITSFPMSYKFDTSEEMNRVSIEPNLEGRVPQIENNQLSIPLGAKVIFPLMHVTPGKEYFLRMQKMVTLGDNLPYLFFRESYQDDWKKIGASLGTVRVIPDKETIQFAFGYEFEGPYYEINGVNHTSLPYYERFLNCKPEITITDTPESNWIITNYPYTLVCGQMPTSDYSLWGAPPITSSEMIYSGLYDEDYRLTTKECSYSYFKSGTLPYMNTTGLKEPNLKFFYCGEENNKQPLSFDYRISDRGEWQPLLNCIPVSNLTAGSLQEYSIALPKDPRLQVRFSCSGGIHHLYVGERQSLSITNAGILDEKPLVTIEINESMQSYLELGIIINGNTIVPRKGGKYSILHMRVPGLKEGASAQVKAYAKDKSGNISYSSEITVIQPISTTTAKKSTTTFVENQTRYSIIRSMFYPGNKKIMIQGICWSTTSQSPTIENNEGIVMLEENMRERLDSIVPAKSGVAYNMRAFQLCEGESIYTYSDLCQFYSGATGQQEITFPFSFENYSQEDLNAYWQYTGPWKIEYHNRLTVNSDRHYLTDTLTLTTPLINQAIPSHGVLAVKGKGISISLINEETKETSSLLQLGSNDTENLFKLPAGIHKFRLVFKLPNTLNQSAEITGFNIIEDNSWLTDAKTPEQDSQGYYLIDSPEKLAWLTAMTNSNGTEWSKNKYFIQTSNLDFENREWIPIGTKTNPFKGVYNGNGFQIDRLKIDTNQPYAGLFGYVTNAKLQNIHIASGYVKGLNYVGAIVAYSSDSEIDNCCNKVPVTGSTKVGGICGNDYNSEFNGCVNFGEILGSNETGTNIGGICGYAYNSEFTTCCNTGQVSGTKEIGGVVGYNSESKSLFRTVYNAGQIKGNRSIGAITGIFSPYQSSFFGVCYDKNTSGCLATSDQDYSAQGVTSEELKSETIINTMNLNLLPNHKYSWEVDRNGGYPVIAKNPYYGTEKQYSKNSQLKVYTSGEKAIILLDQTSTIRIYNVDGLLIKSFSGVAGKNECNLLPGIYIIHVAEQTIKVVIGD